ncbi:hypothetical protein PHLGIDRAFT_339567 [Phlebiopsis gigantea 11061_1 CR5-6]|uniref:Uncharacterized protein n=1 Tax=Phlebiopsis gigantea (strain 11061_1 CR5-6) TaxID=745531 RepID=A0A0C3SAL0_PHLG1|nr:hypothetical protein PHLGIDRAFT_339567 [Phlebiopsis gigantea 11061_1 CR5-6]
MKVEMPHPIPPIEYFSSEDAPLLSEYPQNAHLDVYHYPHNGDFDVATFPETPLLPEAAHGHDDDFSDFVQSPTSELPPKLKGKAEPITSSTRKPTDMYTLSYIRHVAIILLVQLLIPIPFMIPLGINFMKRSVKVFIPGFAVGLVGHSLMNLMFALPSARPLDPSSTHRLPHHLSDSTDVVSTLWAQLKITMLGGAVVGAFMANVINFALLGHIIYSLVRKVEPDPSAMRRAMDASMAYQRAQPVLLDLLTALAMAPAGLAARHRLFGTPLVNKSSAWHLTLVGVVGVMAVHGLRLPSRQRRSSSAAERANVQTTEHVEMHSGKRKGVVRR